MIRLWFSPEAIRHPTGAEKRLFTSQDSYPREAAEGKLGLPGEEKSGGKAGVKLVDREKLRSEGRDDGVGAQVKIQDEEVQIQSRAETRTEIIDTTGDRQAQSSGRSESQAGASLSPAIPAETLGTKQTHRNRRKDIVPGPHIHARTQAKELASSLIRNTENGRMIEIIRIQGAGIIRLGTIPLQPIDSAEIQNRSIERQLPGTICQAEIHCGAIAADAHLLEIEIKPVHIQITIRSGRKRKVPRIDIERTRSIDGQIAGHISHSLRDGHGSIRETTQNMETAAEPQGTAHLGRIPEDSLDIIRSIKSDIIDHILVIPGTAKLKKGENLLRHSSSDI